MSYPAAKLPLNLSDKYRFLSGEPARELDQATYDYFTRRANWSRQMVAHDIVNIRAARLQGRPVFAQRQRSLLEQNLAEFRRHNKERWAAKRRLVLKLWDEP